MNSLTKALALVFASLAVAIPASAQDRISVFVKSAADAGGFTDPNQDRQDSVKDLVKKLNDASRVAYTVDAEKDAVVVLEVVDRETKRETNSFGRQNRSYLTVKLTAGGYSAALTGKGDANGMLTGYGDAARSIVERLDAWMRVNYDRLASLQAGKP